METASTATNSTTLSSSTTTSTSNGCGGDFSGPSGTITSPGWPNGYSINKDCTWNVMCPQGEVVQIAFKKFVLEPHFICK